MVLCSASVYTNLTQVRTLQARLLQQLHRDTLVREAEGRGYAVQHVEGEVYRAALPCRVRALLLTV